MEGRLMYVLDKERAILREIDKKYEYMLRDENGDLILHEKRQGGLLEPCLSFKMFNHLFQDIPCGWYTKIEILLKDE